MGTLALRLTGAAKRYAGAARHAGVVFEGVNLEIERGEVFALLGPSGCGKSTLLRTLAGLESLSAGRVELGQAGDGASTGRAVGMAFQDPLLLPWLTVAENVKLGLRYVANRGAVGDADEAVAEILREFGLGPLAGARPEHLSGGQAQRVSLARTVVTRPSLLLLDEPFASLDPRTRGALQDWLLGIVRERRLTVLLVTHDVEEALYVGDRVGLMGSRSGAGSTITHVWDAGHTNGEGRTRDDERLRAIRREILAQYQTDIPHASAAAGSWVI